MIRRICLSTMFSLMVFSGILAQKGEEEEEKGGFKKENLFTGGSISLSFFNNTFLIGASPVFGYSLTNWADLGVVINYSYGSNRDYNNVLNDKLKQYVYGGGAFVKLYPVKFLFAQAQIEQNHFKEKYIRAVDGYTETAKGKAGSFLVGGGYCSGRQGKGGQPFYYLSVLFDVSGNFSSPYTDSYGRAIPIVRGGFQIPLFQGGGKRGR
jgi:hypothetical protein